jgi:GT2 family glycosyltransferase
MQIVPTHLSLPFEVGYSMGALMIVRKEDIDHVGWFDEKMFLYFEESDLAVRIRKYGFKIICDPKIRIIHFGGGSSASTTTKKYYYKSWGYLVRKHRSFLYHSRIFKFLLLAYLTKRIILKHLRGLKNDRQTLIEEIMIIKESF